MTCAPAPRKNSGVDSRQRSYDEVRSRNSKGSIFSALRMSNSCRQATHSGSLAVQPNTRDPYRKCKGSPQQRARNEKFPLPALSYKYPLSFCLPTSYARREQILVNHATKRISKQSRRAAQKSQLGASVVQKMLILAAAAQRSQLFSTHAPLWELRFQKRKVLQSSRARLGSWTFGRHVYEKPTQSQYQYSQHAPLHLEDVREEVEVHKVQGHPQHRGLRQQLQLPFLQKVLALEGQAVEVPVPVPQHRLPTRAGFWRGMISWFLGEYKRDLVIRR